MGNAFRKGMLVVFMVVTMLAGLFGGLAPTGAALLSQSTSVHAIHGPLAYECPPPPIHC